MDFPENADKSFRFLTSDEKALAKRRISKDRDDVEAGKFSWTGCLVHFLDPKIYAFSVMFFLLNLVSTSLSYFLPIILQSGMGFSSDQAILLSAPPYFYAVIPVIISSIVGDRYQLRGLVITFNCICTIVGFSMLGFASQVTVRYVGTYLATGAYVSNWAAMNAYQASNIVGAYFFRFTPPSGSHVLIITRTMEESNLRCIDHGLQRVRRYRRQLHSETTRSSKIHDCNLGEHWVTHPDYGYCCGILVVFLVCEQRAKKG